MLKKWWKTFGPNPLDAKLEKARKKGHKKILYVWNRGLGDIALGLYAIIHRTKQMIPEAQITFLTRPNLADGFALVPGIDVLVDPEMKRGIKPVIDQVVSRAEYDLIIENLDPTNWVKWQLGSLTPKLTWSDEWDALEKAFDLDPNYRYIGAHVQTETNYAKWRDWPEGHFRTLFSKLGEDPKNRVLLFGYEKNPPFDYPHVIDLRGQTPLFSLLSLIKNRLDVLIVPDSGISSMAYFLDESFPLTHITLWAEKNMGILKQNVASPNPQLKHIPLMSEGNLAALHPDRVLEVVNSL